MSQSTVFTVCLVLCAVCLPAIYARAATTAPPVNRKMAATVFSTAGKKEGLEIWRVENFSPVAVPKGEFGKFYEGDSYIILKTKETKGKLSWDIHYWLGRQTSQDESGSAAILAVELDDVLGGSPVQHRETQEHETQLFLSYFQPGVRYVPGGINSGFSHVTPNAPTGGKKLYQVKGKKNIRVRQVEPKATTMNKGDCYILDSGSNIFVYYGEKSKRTERLKAVSAANQIRDQDHAGRASVKIIDESATQDEVSEFFTQLGGGSVSSLQPEASGGDDEQYERNADTQVTLYKVSDSTGAIKVDPTNVKPLAQAALGTNDCFILDTVTSGIFVWIGKRASKTEKEQAMKKGEDFLKTNNRPKWTQITRVTEGGEPSTFKQYFTGWRESGDRAGLGRVRRAITVQQLTDTISGEDENTITDEKLCLLCKNGGSALTFLPDNGDGDVDVYRVEDFELAPLDKQQHGMFYGGDSYVIKYTYNGNKHIIYYWLGKDSSIDEKAAAAMHTVRLDNELGGAATQVRVVHGNEPRHFNKIFKGKMIIFSGGKASGFKNIDDKDTYDLDGTRLFRIRGTDVDDVRVEQVDEVASSLDSDDTFLLETPDKMYLWFGSNTNEIERNMAQNLQIMLETNHIPIIVEEGQEPEEFWSMLGGRNAYSQESQSVPKLSPRMFHVSVSEHTRENSSEELFSFSKEEMYTDDVLVLDTGDEVYVWVGSGASDDEVNEGIALAKVYLTNSGRDSDAIITIHENHEPTSFTSVFSDW